MIRDLQFFIGQSEVPNACAFDEKKIPLDETRPDDELFTLRSIRNKLNHVFVAAPENQNEISSEELQKALPDAVSTRDFKRFFEDPFQFQLSRKVTLPSVENSPEKQLFEPVALDNLERSILLRDFVQSILEADEKKDSKTEQEWILKKKIPRGVFGEAALDEINKESLVLYKLITDSPECQNPAYQEKMEIPLTEGSHGWTLRSKFDWHKKNVDGVHLLFSVKSGDVSNSDFIKLFLDALVIAAAESDPEKETQFVLRVYSSKNKVGEKMVSLKRSVAIELLKALYHRCFVENYRKCVPAKMYDEKDLQTFFNYRLKLSGRYGAWSYFDGKNLFDPEKFSGFSYDNFVKEWNDAVMEQTNLLDPIWSDDDEE